MIKCKYKPPLPIQYLGFPFHISHSERWACSGCYSIFFSLCPSSALMAVYTLGNISTQIKFWKMISMQLLCIQCGHKTGQFQVGVGDMAKIYQYFMILSRFFVMLVLLFVWVVWPD